MSRPRAGLAAPALAVLLAACAARAGGDAAATGPNAPDADAPSAEWPVVLADDFEAPASLERFAFSDPERWSWAREGDRGELVLAEGSRYRPPVRSPGAIALVRDLELGDLDLAVDVRQTGREYGHRDLCFFLGFESPSRFYYVHLATAPDPHAHNVFLVEDAPRRALVPVPAKGMDWGEGWHHVRVERHLADGLLRVSVDGDTRLSVHDTTLGRGRVGLGSFDDQGRFAHLTIRSPDARRIDGGDPFPR